MALNKRNRFSALANKEDLNPGTAAALEIMGVPNEKKEGEKKISDNIQENLIDQPLKDENSNDIEQGKENLKNISSPPSEDIETKQIPEPQKIKEIKRGSKIKNDRNIVDEDSKTATTHISKSLMKDAKVTILTHDLNQTIQEFTEDAIRYYIKILEKRK
jgi:hypothetical protein